MDRFLRQQVRELQRQLSQSWADQEVLKDHIEKLEAQLGKIDESHNKRDLALSYAIGLLMDAYEKFVTDEKWRKWFEDWREEYRSSRHETTRNL